MTRPVALATFDSAPFFARWRARRLPRSADACAEHPQAAAC